MRELKVGDLVITDSSNISRYNSKHKKLATGKIVYKGDGVYLLEFDDKKWGNTYKDSKICYKYMANNLKEGKSYWQISDYNIRSTLVKATRLAKKMFPDAKEEGGCLLIPNE